jgi:hypothetical protein
MTVAFRDTAKALDAPGIIKILKTAVDILYQTPKKHRGTKHGSARHLLGKSDAFA